MIMSEVWLRRLGRHGPRLWAGGELQHDEGRKVLQDGGFPLTVAEVVDAFAYFGSLEGTSPL